MSQHIKLSEMIVIIAQEFNGKCDKGGLFGVFFDTGWSPDCWYGLLAVFGIVVISGACD